MLVTSYLLIIILEGGGGGGGVMGLDIVILFGARNREAMRFFFILT